MRALLPPGWTFRGRVPRPEAARMSSESALVEDGLSGQPALDHLGVADLRRPRLLQRPDVAVHRDEVGELPRGQAPDVAAPDRLVGPDGVRVHGLVEAD